MHVLGHGIDLVDTARFAEVLDHHGQRFLDRCFTPDEQAYCEAGSKRRVEHYAARFAAKEAVLKALGTGLTEGIRWTDVQILRSPAGQPSVQLSGAALGVATQRGIAEWWISLSHIESHAMASAIAEG